MKTRYLNTEQFRTEVANTKGETGTIIVVPKVDERLVVLASSLPEIRALGDPESRLIEFIITDESVDRMSDSIKIDGWEVDDYEANPVVLWAHSHYDPPVGKSINLTVDKKKKQIRSIAEFMERDLSEFSYMIYRMYVKRFLNAVSVGFQPKEYTWVSTETDAERARRGGIDFLKQSLLEYSSVPVPANPNALAVARSSGIDTAPMKAWAERVLDEHKLTEEQRGYLDVLRTAASPVGRSLILEITDIKTAKEDEPVKKNPPALVKRVVTESWDCGIKGHEHTTEVEATTCASVLSDVTKLIMALVASAKAIETINTKRRAAAEVNKSGRVLSKKNENTLSEAVAAVLAAAEKMQGVLDQVKQEDEEQEDEDEDDKTAKNTGVIKTIEPEPPVEKFTIKADPAKVTAAIKQVVNDTIARMGGRVD